MGVLAKIGCWVGMHDLVHTEEHVVECIHCGFATRTRRFT